MLKKLKEKYVFFDVDGVPKEEAQKFFRNAFTDKRETF